MILSYPLGANAGLPVGGVCAQWLQVMKQHFALHGIQPFFVAALAALGLLVSTGTAPAALKPLALRCEYRVNPLGIDEAQPRLTWRVESAERGQRQTAYQVLVASSPQLLRSNTGDLWDSGKLAGGQTVNIVYAGKALASRQRCFWKVRVWDREGRPTWSESAMWTMGLLQPAEWRASYISHRDSTPLHKDPKTLFLPPARQYRKEFSAAKPVSRATVYATALGIYELYVNGQRV